MLRKKGYLTEYVQNGNKEHMEGYVQVVEDGCLDEYMCVRCAEGTLEVVW
jgi:hypothetical protein